MSDVRPVEESTGLGYVSTAWAVGTEGNEVPVMHARGHDVHVATLLGAAALLAKGCEHWHGTLVALFRPAEEAADGARSMVDDGLAALLPHIDVALAQHVLPAPAGLVGTRSGAVLSAADSIRITEHGPGAPHREGGVPGVRFAARARVRAVRRSSRSLRTTPPSPNASPRRSRSISASGSGSCRLRTDRATIEYVVHIR